jgi:hypothetical protein
MDQASFRARIGGATTFATDQASLTDLPEPPTGGAPAPFDGLDTLRLSGPSGSHPLAGVELRQLVSGPTSGLEGAIEIDGPARLGEAISGRLRIRARQPIRARSAVLRLIGIRLYEETRSAQKRPDPAAQAAQSLAQLQASLGQLTPQPGGSPAPATTSATPETVSWVEVRGEVLEMLPFMEPALPASLDAGQVLDLPFTIPAPRLGPPTAHAGVGAIAWAVEAHWEVDEAADERVAGHVEILQHPELLRAGALPLPPGALDGAVTDEGATIAVDPVPPVAAGTPLQVRVAWPGAPGGRAARVELNLDVSGTNGLGQVIASVPADHEALESTSVTLPVPPDLPPTLTTDGLTVGYRIRVIVDRKLRSDESRERAVVLG